MINIFFEDTAEIDLTNLKIEQNIEKLAKSENRTLGDISYILCSDNYLLDINRQYLNHDYFTDVITFDYSEENVISGDIFISVDTVADNAKEYNVTFEKELERVMVHGVLHLVGYNDKSDSEVKQMRAKENQYLSLFD